MFLHDYHLACEISTVRTLALKQNQKNKQIYLFSLVLALPGP